MRLSRLSWMVLGVALCAQPALAQARACLHMGIESPAEVRRREEALAAVRMINTAMGRGGRVPNQPVEYPTWEELAASSPVATLRGMGGPLGELARKIEWGGDEPLPGWEIHHVSGPNAYAFSLTDLRDPCRFAYVADETGTIVEGHPINGGRRGGIVPIT